MGDIEKVVKNAVEDERINGSVLFKSFNDSLQMVKNVFNRASITLSGFKCSILHLKGVNDVKQTLCLQIVLKFLNDSCKSVK
jgi:hypothetical protein